MSGRRRLTLAFLGSSDHRSHRRPHSSVPNGCLQEEGEVVLVASDRRSRRLFLPSRVGFLSLGLYVSASFSSRLCFLDDLSHDFSIPRWAECLRTIGLGHSVSPSPRTPSYGDEFGKRGVQGSPPTYSTPLPPPSPSPPEAMPKQVAKQDAEVEDVEDNSQCLPSSRLTCLNELG